MSIPRFELCLACIIQNCKNKTLDNICQTLANLNIKNIFLF